MNNAIEREIPHDLTMMPEGWQVMQLSSIIDKERSISYGVVQPGSFDPEGVPIIRVNNVKDGQLALDDVLRVSHEIERSYSRTRLRGGEILLTVVGSLGECVVVPKELAGWNIARAIAVIPVDPVFHPRWVALCLRSPIVKRYIDAWAVTTVQPTLNLRDVAKLPIIFPPKKELEFIQELLCSLDNKIDLNRQMNKTLESIGKAIFKHWFIDFEFPNEGKPYKSSGGERVYNEELGKDIPKGWRLAHLDEIAKNPRRGILPDGVDRCTPYFGLEHMPRKSIALSEWETAEKVSSNKFQFYQGEILFGKLRPYFHKVGVAPVDGVCSTDILVITPESSKFYSLVLSHVSSEKFVKYADSASTGTRMPRANWEHMSLYEILIPPDSVTKAFNDIVMPMVQKICANVLQSQVLGAIRDSLLPKLISGKIRVPVQVK